MAQAAGEGEALHLSADSAQTLRVIAINVPENPGYTLYRKMSKPPILWRIGGSVAADAEQRNVSALFG